MEFDIKKTGVVDSAKTAELCRELIPDLSSAHADSSVYHYTSIGGVEGILKGKMRFTDIRYMNDREEVVVGVEEFKKNFMRNYSAEYKSLIERNIEQIAKMHTFVCCFSLDRDSLAMWNYYTKDINNKGFSLGFDYKSLIVSILQSNKELDGCTFLFGYIDYTNKEETYAQLAEKQLVDSLVNALDSLTRYLTRMIQGDEATPKHASRKHPDFPVLKYAGEIPSFEKVISPDAVFFMKRPCFSIESEFRIVIQVPDESLSRLKNAESGKQKYKFRLSNGLLIPYLELDFDLQCLTGITFSPTINDELAENSIADYCRYCGIDPNGLPEKVQRSSVPVRY